MHGSAQRARPRRCRRRRHRVSGARRRPRQGAAQARRRSPRPRPPSHGRRGWGDAWPRRTSASPQRTADGPSWRRGLRRAGARRDEQGGRVSTKRLWRLGAWARYQGRWFYLRLAGRVDTTSQSSLSALVRPDLREEQCKRRTRSVNVAVWPKQLRSGPPRQTRNTRAVITCLLHCLRQVRSC